jgi:hypothetical protein
VRADVKVKMTVRYMRASATLGEMESGDDLDEWAVLDARSGS